MRCFELNRFAINSICSLAQYLSSVPCAARSSRCMVDACFARFAVTAPLVRSGLVSIDDDGEIEFFNRSLGRTG